MPDLDACTSCEVNQFRIVQPVDFGVVILGRIDDTPFIILINVWIQGNLLLCRNRSDSETDRTRVIYVGSHQDNCGGANVNNHLEC